LTPVQKCQTAIPYESDHDLCPSKCLVARATTFEIGILLIGVVTFIVVNCWDRDAPGL